MRVALILSACTLLCLSLARCTGCSAQCTGQNLGSAGCPCASDQDCTTRQGTVLLCVDGNCVEGNPDDAAGGAPCATSDACPAGQACGFDGVCLPAPTCQRIDAPLGFTVVNGAGNVVETGSLTATRADCAHTWSATSTAHGSIAATVAVDLDGNITATGDCAFGHWFAGARVGSLTCSADTWAVSPADVAVCLACDAGCAASLDGAGTFAVCP